MFVALSTCASRKVLISSIILSFWKLLGAVSMGWWVSRNLSSGSRTRPSVTSTWWIITMWWRTRITIRFWSPPGTVYVGWQASRTLPVVTLARWVTTILWWSWTTIRFGSVRDADTLVLGISITPKLLGATGMILVRTGSSWCRIVLRCIRLRTSLRRATAIELRVCTWPHTATTLQIRAAGGLGWTRPRPAAAGLVGPGPWASTRAGASVGVEILVAAWVTLAVLLRIPLFEHGRFDEGDTNTWLLDINLRLLDSRLGKA